MCKNVVPCSVRRIDNLAKPRQINGLTSYGRFMGQKYKQFSKNANERGNKCVKKRGENTLALTQFHEFILVYCGFESRIYFWWVLWALWDGRE